VFIFSKTKKNSKRNRKASKEIKIDRQQTRENGNNHSTTVNPKL